MPSYFLPKSKIPIDMQNACGIMRVRTGGRMDSYEIENNVQKIRKPIIVSFDLEVSPALGYYYPPTWETGILKTKERQRLMSFAWHVVGETTRKKVDGVWQKVPKIHALNLSHMDTYKVDPFNDKLLTMELHKVMSSADILLGQNSDQFDVKMANYFFIMNGLSPVPPTKYIDTKKIAKRYFRFQNNTLDNLGEELGFGGKTQITYKDLWVPAYLQGDKKSWKLMDEYCKNDVDKTTKIYLKMRPFMRSHPNLARITGEFDSCPRCGGFDYRVKAYRTTDVSRYKQYYCNTCGGYFSDRKAITETDGDIKPKFVSR